MFLKTLLTFIIVRQGSKWPQHLAFWNHTARNEQHRDWEGPDQLTGTLSSSFQWLLIGWDTLLYSYALCSCPTKVGYTGYYLSWFVWSQVTKRPAFPTCIFEKVGVEIHRKFLQLSLWSLHNRKCDQLSGCTYSCIYQICIEGEYVSHRTLKNVLRIFHDWSPFRVSDSNRRVERIYL